MIDKKDENHDFSALLQAYRKNMTIENYVRLRRAYPDETTEPLLDTTHFGWWGGEIGAVLERYGLDGLLIASAMDADEAALSEVSLLLMEGLIEKKVALERGETHVARRGVAIEDALVNYVIVKMLDALDFNDDLYIPRELIVLIRHQLIGDKYSSFDRGARAEDLKASTLVEAARLIEQGQQPTVRLMAKMMNVNPSTISRMFPENSLLDEAQKLFNTFKAISKVDKPFADLDKIAKEVRSKRSRGSTSASRTTDDS